MLKMHYLKKKNFLPYYSNLKEDNKAKQNKEAGKNKGIYTSSSPDPTTYRVLQFELNYN